MVKHPWLDTWKQHARLFKTEAHTLYLAYRDPRVPWYARLYAAFVVGYIFSPIDLIPDFIPIIGYLDELVLIPIFVSLSRKMIPASILTEHRATAQAATGFGTRKHWLAAAVIVTVWVVIAIAGIVLARRLIT